MKGSFSIMIQEISNVLNGTFADKVTTIRGWIYRTRSSGGVSFVQIRDATGVLQCTIKQDKVDVTSFENSQKALVESSVIVTGKVVADKRAPGGFEIQATKFEVVHFAEIYPITKDQSTEHLLNYRHLWIRSRYMTTILRIRSTVIQAIHDFYREKGFLIFDPPIFTPNACEGGATLFEVKYFKEKVYLTQSWQLYGEAGIFALEKIYCVSPSFRAEASKTSRHLTEFWHSEMEMAWGDLNTASQMAKEKIKFILTRVLEKHEKELTEVLGRDTSKLKICLEKDYPTITYTDAIKVLKDKCKIEVPWGKDLRTIEEEELMKHFDTPVVVTNYPKEIMAFYKPADPKDPKTALCFDMLAPEGYGEIVGGSQREIDIEELKKGLEREGEKPENYEWHMDLRKYGSVPHAGYGMGIERVVRWICGLENIKDAIAFPRTMHRWTP